MHQKPRFKLKNRKIQTLQQHSVGQNKDNRVHDQIPEFSAQIGPFAASHRPGKSERLHSHCHAVVQHADRRDGDPVGPSAENISADLLQNGEQNKRRRVQEARGARGAEHEPGHKARGRREAAGRREAVPAEGQVQFRAGGFECDVGGD